MVTFPVECPDDSEIGDRHHLRCCVVHLVTVTFYIKAN